MKTVLVGAGKGCRAVLELSHQGRLPFLDLEILALVDRNPDAVGCQFGRAQGWPIMDSISEAMSLPGLELVIELTGSDAVLAEINSHLPPGIRVMDHVLARVFWDLEQMFNNLQEELEEKTRLEARVQEDKARLQEILDSLPELVMVMDTQMRVMRVNRRFEEVTKTPWYKATGKFCYESFCRNETLMNCTEFTCPFIEVMRTQAPAKHVYYGEGRSGKQGYYQVTANPIFDSRGNLIRVVETSREITEQVLLKRETEESARRFKQIMNAVHGIITIKDLSGRFQLANPRACALLGLSEKDLVGRAVSEVLPPEVAEIMEHNDEIFMKQGGHIVSEERLHLGDKEVILVSERFGLKDYKGDVVSLCCVARDVTTERQLQREVLSSERLAAVGKLAAGVAHELNNPLTGVLTFAEDLLLDVDPQDPVAEDYKLIMQETLRCRRIVRDLLDYSRQKEPQRSPAQVNQIVRRTINLVERQASFQDVVFGLELDSGLPAILVDSTLIQQAILNLVINARDAMQMKGRIVIASGMWDGARGVMVSVSDDGVGIPEDRLCKIFEPFFSTKGEQGTGLGLSAVVSIMEQHGGRVEVDSTPGVGSTFRLVFPLGDGTTATGAKK